MHVTDMGPTGRKACFRKYAVFYRALARAELRGLGEAHSATSRRMNPFRVQVRRVMRPGWGVP